MKFSIFFVFLLIVTTSSCSSLPRPKTDTVINFESVENLSLNLAQDVVRSKFNPSVVVNLSNEEEGWNFNNVNNEFQIAAMTFSKNSKLLISKMIIVEEGTRESELDYLLNEKFKLVKFTLTDYPRCGRHFKNTSKIYWSKEQGLMIQYSPMSDSVENVTWATPDATEKIINSIQNCQL